jgi:hypothetical protein
VASCDTVILFVEWHGHAFSSAASIYGRSAGSIATHGKSKLAYVVILSRHGVRSPIATNEALKQYAAEPWPNWRVPPGELTEHGLIVTHTVEAAADPLFHPVPELAHSDAALAAAAVSGRIGNNPAAVESTLQHAFGTLREVLFGCAPSKLPLRGRSSRGNKDCSICRRRLAARRTALPTSADLPRPAPRWPKISGSNTRRVCAKKTWVGDGLTKPA